VLLLLFFFFRQGSSNRVAYDIKAPHEGQWYMRGGDLPLSVIYV